MTEETHPILDITLEELEAFFRRALRITLVLGLLSALAVLIGAGWRSAAMLMTGAVISAASILEWQRLVRIIQAKMEKRQSPRSTGLVLVLFVLRLTIFAGVIYGSLKCFHGSVVALLCGLGLAALAILWETMRMLRD